MKKLTIAAAVLWLGFSLSTKAQTLLYQWNFTNSTDTATSSVPTFATVSGTGKLGLINVSGDAITPGLIYFTNANSGPPKGPGGALVLNGQSYNGSPSAVATNSSLNLGTLYQFTVTFWHQYGSTVNSAPSQFPRLVQFGASVTYDVGGKGGGNVNGVGTSVNGATTAGLFSQFQNGVASATGSNPQVTITGDPNFPSGFVCDGQTWYFEALTYDGFLTANNFTVWLASTNTSTLTGTAGVIPFVQSQPRNGIPFTTNASVILAGCVQGGPRALTQGQIADVRIYSGVMSSNNLQLIRNFQQPNLVVNPPAGASITVQPTSGKTFTGGNRTFAVSAVGNPATFTYLWRSNNVAITSATNSSFTLSNVTASANGASFVCSVSNIVGGTNSIAGTITVVTPTPGSYANVLFTNKPYSLWLVNESSNSPSVLVSDYAKGNDGISSRPAGDLFDGGPSSPFFLGFPINNTAIEVPAPGGNGPLDTPALPIYTNTGMTICGWVYMPTTGTGNGLIYSKPSDTLNGFGLTLNNGGELDYGWGGGDRTGSGLIIPTAEWTFVALVVSTNLTQYDIDNSITVDTNATLYVGSLSGGGLQKYVDSTAQSGNVISSGTSPAVLALGRTTVTASENGGHYAQNNVRFNAAAVFYTALSAQTITNLYTAGGVSLYLNIVPDINTPGNVLITWPIGTLQEATAVNGPYTDVAGPPASPYSVTASDAQHYFRVRN